MPVERSKDHIARVGELSDPLEGVLQKAIKTGSEAAWLACFDRFRATAVAELRQGSPTYHSCTAAKPSCSHIGRSTRYSHLLSQRLALPISQGEQPTLA